MALLLTLAASPVYGAEGGRHDVVEARVQALIVAAERSRLMSAPRRARTIGGWIDRAVDLRAWLGDAVPDLEALAPADRARILEKTRLLLIARITDRLAVPGAFRVTLDKTRLGARARAVDCLVHTADAIYEVTLRWSLGGEPRLRDVLVEGVSIGAADRRRIRRAWDQGGLRATLHALDRAIGILQPFSGPPAVATRTSPARPAPAPSAPPPAKRPPGL